MMLNLIFYLNGKFLPEDEAKISVLDLGFVRGYGVFDFLRTYHGKPFKLDEHLQRLLLSAKQVDLEIAWTVAKLKELIFLTLKKNYLPDANIKIIISGGESTDGITPIGRPTLAIIVKPLVSYPKDYYVKGVKVITVDLVRELPEIKSTNYISAMMARNLATKKGAIEALYKNEKNEILEGTQTNFFCLKDHILITPENKILAGVTRGIVLELAAKEFRVELRPIKYNELKDMDEAFITATTKEVMPVVKIDDIKIGNGKVGKNTKRIMALFRRYTRC